MHTKGHGGNEAKHARRTPGQHHWVVRSPTQHDAHRPGFVVRFQQRPHGLPGARHGGERSVLSTRIGEPPGPTVVAPFGHIEIWRGRALVGRGGQRHRRRQRAGRCQQEAERRSNCRPALATWRRDKGVDRGRVQVLGRQTDRLSRSCEAAIGTPRRRTRRTLRRMAARRRKKAREYQPRNARMGTDRSINACPTHHRGGWSSRRQRCGNDPEHTRSHSASAKPPGLGLRQPSGALALARAIKRQTTAAVQDARA